MSETHLWRVACKNSFLQMIVIVTNPFGGDVVHRAGEIASCFQLIACVTAPVAPLQLMPSASQSTSQLESRSCWLPRAHN